MATNINTIKNWFKTNLKPTQAQFWAWLDSYWHKDEQIPITKIEDISNILNNKADAQALTNHLTDANAHATELDNKVDKIAGKGLSDVNFSQEDKDKLDALGDRQKKYIDGYWVDTTGNTDINAIEVGNIITKELDGLFVYKVNALPHTTPANLITILENAIL